MTPLEAILTLLLASAKIGRALHWRLLIALLLVKFKNAEGRSGGKRVRLSELNLCIEEE